MSTTFLMIGTKVPNYKKGGRKKCENYRGITLLNQPFKIYEHILKNELHLEIKTKLEEEQYAVRKERATIDLISLNSSSRENLKPGPGFEPQTSRSLAWHSTT